ncbi:hypothetical protein D9M69_422640 [compost metagenome]
MPGGLGGEERLEQPCEGFLGQPGPVVAHGQVDHAAAHVRMQRDARGRPADDRIERIAKQVDQHLLEPVGVADHGQLGVDVALQFGLYRFHAGLQQEHRVVDRLAQPGLPEAVARLARERLERAGDAAHALDQPDDGVEIGAHRGVVAALEELAGVAGQRAQRRQRLVQLVRDAGRHLAHRGQLAGLQQAVLRLAQHGLGADALGHLGLQPVVGGGQVGGALGHLALQLAVGRLQRGARGQALVDDAPAHVPGRAQQQHEGSQHARQRGAVERRHAHLRGIGQQRQLPVGAGQGGVLGQHRRAAAQAHQFVAAAAVAIGQLAHRDQRQLRQRRAVVLQAARQPLARLVRQRAQRRQFPRRVRGQDHDAVLVAQQHLAVGALPAVFQRLQPDLDHRHAGRVVAFAQRRRQVVARFAARGADAVEAAELALHGSLEVRAEAEVLAHVAVGALPVAGGQHLAVGVQHIDHARAGAGIERGQVFVGAGHARGVVRAQQQSGDTLVQRQQAGHVVVVRQLAFQRLRVQAQLHLAALGLARQRVVVAVAVAERAGQPDQHGQRQQRQQRRGAAQAVGQARGARGCGGGRVRGIAGRVERAGHQEVWSGKGEAAAPAGQ